MLTYSVTISYSLPCVGKKSFAPTRAIQLQAKHLIIAYLRLFFVLGLMSSAVLTIKSRTFLLRRHPIGNSKTFDSPTDPTEWNVKLTPWYDPSRATQMKHGLAERSDEGTLRFALIAGSYSYLRP